ncbi:hypothetical protein QPK87_19340 [Kamptonema cortianum]|nr:hypothetical protein [Geitlerinema splendidum]MDK3158711.1 hypothetical protein [Kamptonema cortianum]
MTTAETFVWYRATPELRLGIAHLWKQNSFRFLASIRILAETENRPSLSASAGVQGIGTGNPGYSLTLEKNVDLDGLKVNAFAGVGFRSNESHGHPLGGVKLGVSENINIGFQNDGHQTHPFITFSKDEWVAGFYLIDGKSAAWMLGVRF